MSKQSYTQSLHAQWHIVFISVHAKFIKGRHMQNKHAEVKVKMITYLSEEILWTTETVTDSVHSQQQHHQQHHQ